MDRGYEHYGSNREPARRNHWLVLIDSIMFVVTLVAAALLIGAYLARYSDPSTFWMLAFIGLAAPVLYICNLILALYWIARWRLFVFVPLAVLALGAGSVSLFFRPSISKQYPVENRQRSFKMVSYNVRGFLSPDEQGTMVSTRDSILAFVVREDPDLVCFQEFETVSGRTRAAIDSALEFLSYNAVHYKVNNSHAGGWGLAIYSRYPLLESGNVNFANSSNASLWADIVVNDDTIRVFNNHLQTTSVNSSDRQYIDNQEFMQSAPDRKQRVRSILSKMKRNYRIRAQQVDSLAPLIHSSPFDVIVCGDFNDTPMSYAYHTMRGDLLDAFVEKGQGMPNTYRGLFNLFRIDYILHSDRLQTVSYTTPPCPYSDHKPLVVELEFPE